MLEPITLRDVRPKMNEKEKLETQYMENNHRLVRAVIWTQLLWVK